MQPDPRVLPPSLGASLSRGIAHDLTETGISEVAMTVFGEPDIVPLWFGEGDLVTPDFVRDAASTALQAGETFYTWQRGLPELQADDGHQREGRDVDPVEERARGRRAAHGHGRGTPARRRAVPARP